jgi:predicted dehydrogenase
MSDSPLRLALISHTDKLSGRSEALRRVRGGEVTLTADSLEAASGENAEFDAAVVDSSADAVRAIAAGKHVFVGAPVADSLEEAEALLEAAQEAGVFLSVGGLPVNVPANRVILDRLSSGKLGEPGLLRVHCWSGESSRSLASKLYGHIDLAIRFFGSSPAELYCVARGDQSYLQVHLGFAGGGMAVLDFSDRLPAGQGYDSLSLVGSSGAAYSDDHHNTHLLFAGGNPAALIDDCGDGLLDEVQAFVDALAGEALPPTDGEAILTVHRLLEAIGRSSESAGVLHDRGGSYEPA